jgi:predicted Zn-ribbon and HTH transcriptional regulator
MTKKTSRFTRTIEDFTCEHCGFFVKGNGYTNHCPKCLYSRHVDIHPGDRQDSCRGMMAPVGLEIKNAEHIIIQRCEKCGYERKNRAVPEDDYNEILKLSADN